MKQLLVSVCLLVFVVASAQTLVGTAPTPRNAVLEEFTGINCSNCPDGHVRAQALYNAYPARVNIINIHATSWAVPTAGRPEFRTPFGNTLDALAATAGYPSGTMNRQVWSGAYNVPPYFPQNPPNNLAIRRNGWWDTSYPGQGTGAYIILNGGTSPVNIGVKTSWNVTTRELTVNVELYYTSDQTVDNELNVALLQSNIIGYQSNGGNSYNHKHVLRHLLTGQYGDVITTPTVGYITKTYTYTVPSSYTFAGTVGNPTTCNIDDCDITVFVTKNDHKTNYTGITCKAKDGQSTTTATGIAEIFTCLSDVNVYPNPLTDMSTVQFSLESVENTNIELYNVLGDKVLTKEIGKLSAGTHNLSLDFIGNALLSQGIYVLKINSGIKSATLKVMI